MNKYEAMRSDNLQKVQEWMNYLARKGYIVHTYQTIVGSGDYIVIAYSVLMEYSPEVQRG
jgi:hypothetical protein